MNNDALIGYTGYVGGTILNATLKAGRSFRGLYNSKNIGELVGQNFDTIYCAGAPAAKWIANKEPEQDLANINSLLHALKCAKARQIVLISTVDVYKTPLEVTEEDIPTTEGLGAYGRNRFYLEQEIAKQFSTTILRLPGLFGTGLKKNAIFDLLNNNGVEKIESRSSFQFYDMSNLLKDIEKTLSLKIKLLNVATAPLTIHEIARECFDRDFRNELASLPASYDFRSIHSRKWGGADGYLYSREQLLKGLREFVRTYQRSPQ